MLSLQTLYIRNLSRNVEEADLVSVFIHLQDAHKEPIVFRLMQRGRMRGQAFVQFAGEATASLTCYAHQL